MKQRVGMITIGVDDLKASLKFYRDGLGLETEGIIGTEFEHGATAVFDLQHGFKLALFARPDLALDEGIATGGRSPTEFTLGHNVGSESDVDAVMRQANAAGARIVKPEQKPFGVDKPVTFRTLMVIYGRSFTTRRSFQKIEATKSRRVTSKHGRVSFPALIAEHALLAQHHRQRLGILQTEPLDGR